jgi:hypothetical protein
MGVAGVTRSMRALRVVVAALIGAVSFVLLTAAPSAACSCASMSTAEHVEESEVIVVGSVDTREESDVPAVTDTVAYTMTVDRTLKGEADETIEVISHSSGVSCGLEEIRLGEDYVVFASHTTIMGDSSDHLWTGLCTGTALATPELVTEVEAAVVDGPPPLEATPMSHEAVEPVTPAADQEEAAAELTGTPARTVLWVAAVAGLVGVAVTLWWRRRRA